MQTLTFSWLHYTETSGKNYLQGLSPPVKIRKQRAQPADDKGYS